ncbi:MAG: GIY-YIG nuclease family protein [bacterium]|nr:GIY-YIG nuclease family protein [bacterium]
MKIRRDVKRPSRVRRDVSRYYVYILYSSKDYGLYIGYSTNLKKRLLQHSKNQVTATKLRTPFKLIHYEYFVNKTDAKAREEFLKSGYGRKQLDQILKRTFKIYLKTPSGFAFRNKILI